MEIKDQVIDFKQVPLMTLTGANGELIRFEYNGDIFYKGNLIESDKEIVDAFREFLIGQGYSWL